MSRRTKLAFIFAAFIMLTVGKAQNATAQTHLPSDTATTASQAIGRGYSLTVPVGWCLSKINDDFLSLNLASKQLDEPMVFITAERVKKAPTAKELHNELITASKSNSGFELLSDQAISVHGVPGFEVAYQYRVGIPIRIERVSQVMVVRGSIVYSFQYEALPSDFAAHSPDFDAMLQSVQWNNRNLSENVPSIATLIGRMSNQIYSERVSPNGHYVATLAYRDGLTYGFEFLSLQVKAKWHPLRLDDPIPADEVAEMADEGIEGISWSGPHKLVVEYDKSIPKECFVIRAKHWHNVRIVWEADSKK